jgi:light-regulated signal transduction histidine kinase (bacteriophytochrome)
MFAPTIIVTVTNGTDESLIAALLFTTYFVFLLSAAKKLNKEYWEALDNTLLLKQRARELELKNKELESFTYSVSHDLRAPLRSIDGFSQLILEDAWQKLDDTEREYLQRVRAAAQKMGVLIDDLLQLSDVSRAGYKPEDIDLSRMVENNLEKLRQLEPNREIEVEIQPNVKATGDQSLLEIAVSNLVANAWKYSSRKPRAKIRFAAQEQNGQIVYYIKDNGVGFDTRYINKLFKPFQRLHTDDEFPGTGIGLATVQRIIDRHGGKIWANAKVGRGATFYFTLTNHMRWHAKGA